MPNAVTDSLLLMGRCGRTHGVRGEVKVFPETDDPDRFLALDRVFVGETPASATERSIARVRLQPQKGRTLVLLHLKGLTTPEEAGSLRNLSVFAHEDDLPPLEEGEVYLHDLIGLAVVEVDDNDEPASEAVGTVRDVFDGGAQRLLVVARDGQPDVLVPDVPQIVLAVDLGAARILVRLPDGLLD
ncbi:MAG: 16S rRNA processing protein RimM [Rhodothermaceae bacterium]|nr:16S rRNA processing protein RimM [Rhodothermaceae bacterium]